jgi:hypothetical protein
MKDKQNRRARQVVEIELYRKLCIELLKIITSAGIKLPPNILSVVATVFPIASKTKPQAIIYEKRCPVCRNAKKCVTGQFRFIEGGCGDKFKKKIYLFWVKVK